MGIMECYPVQHGPYAKHSWQQYWSFDHPPKPVPGIQICGVCHSKRTVHVRPVPEDTEAALWE